MVIVGLFRVEVPLRSVSDTPRHTLSADVADACLFINKKASVQHVATPLLA